MEMYCDNTGVIILANEVVVQKDAIHYRRKVHYLREVITDNDIKVLKVYTDDNATDPFIKAFPCKKYTGHTRSIGLRLASSLI
ncbi:hypothetical protein Tco_0572916 [Tanacetum coccineum]